MEADRAREALTQLRNQFNTLAAATPALKHLLGGDQGALWSWRSLQDSLGVGSYIEGQSIVIPSGFFGASLPVRADPDEQNDPAFRTFFHAYHGHVQNGDEFERFKELATLAFEAARHIPGALPDWLNRYWQFEEQSILTPEPPARRDWHWMYLAHHLAWSQPPRAPFYTSRYVLCGFRLNKQSQKEYMRFPYTPESWEALWRGQDSSEPLLEFPDLPDVDPEVDDLPEVPPWYSELRFSVATASALAIDLLTAAADADVTVSAPILCSKAELLRALKKDPSNLKYLDRRKADGQLSIEKAPSSDGHASYLVRFTDLQEHDKVVQAIEQGRSKRLEH